MAGPQERAELQPESAAGSDWRPFAAAPGAAVTPGPGGKRSSPSGCAGVRRPRKLPRRPRGRCSRDGVISMPPGASRGRSWGCELGLWATSGPTRGLQSWAQAPTKWGGLGTWDQPPPVRHRPKGLSELWSAALSPSKGRAEPEGRGNAKAEPRRGNKRQTPLRIRAANCSL